jgi:hypothetical protein
MSTIPIVQGHAVNDGIPYMAANDGVKDDMNYGHQQQEQSFINPSGQQQHQQQQPRKFKDAIWAVAFIAHLVVMCVVIGLGIGAGGGGGGATLGAYHGVVFVVATTAIASIAVSTATLSLMMRYTTEMVKAALIFTVLLSLLVAVLGFLAGQILLGECGVK